MKHRPAIIVTCMVALLLVVGYYTVYPKNDGESQLWLEDFAALQTSLAAGYANLEWSIEQNHIDPYALSRDTGAQLANTSSRRKARKVIEQFIATFNDPHLRAKQMDAPPTSGGDSSEPEVTGLSNTSSAKDVLSYLGFRKGNGDFKLKFSAVEGFERLSEDGPFDAGVATLPDGRKLGIIRIAYFGEDRYYQVAAETWEDYRARVDGECDRTCLNEFWYAVGDRLLDVLVQRVRDLQREQIDVLAVDITGNGGGSDWADAAARVFSGDQLRCAPFGFVRHPHWQRRFERELKWVEEDLASPGLSPSARTQLEHARDQLGDLIEVTGTACDRNRLWSTAHAALECDAVIRKAYTSCGLFSYLDSHEVAQLRSRWALFTPLRFKLQEGVWDGPLFVIVDGGTASASEQFATLLQMNGAAVIVGERTTGAGCGYTYGGISVYLEHVQLNVRMPDCVRYRADGDNELAGVEPDAVVWDEDDNSKRRAQKAVAAIANMDMGD